jgi:2-polyprenyl-3-methyl-5-hydroxy-6-metoxy-1,4-benzoquinol methylase
MDLPKTTRTPLGSHYARQKRINHFIGHLRPEMQILEIGCGAGWVGQYLKNQGFRNYTGIDLYPPADIVGDIKQWQRLGIKPRTYDAIIAFEVVEHVDCFEECCEILKPGGLLLVTTPVPRMDWACQILEAVGINQKRTSPHDHLIDLRTVQCLQLVELRIANFIGQWAIFRKPVKRFPA